MHCQQNIKSFLTGAKQSISYVSANKELRVTACDNWTADGKAFGQ